MAPVFGSVSKTPASFSFWRLFGSFNSSIVNTMSAYSSGCSGSTTLLPLPLRRDSLEAPRTSLLYFSIILCKAGILSNSLNTRFPTILPESRLGIPILCISLRTTLLCTSVLPRAIISLEPTPR